MRVQSYVKTTVIHEGPKLNSVNIPNHEGPNFIFTKVAKLVVDYDYELVKINITNLFSV